ncbi:hypothetical protein HMPREF9630_01121 [Peptoanaerobacter stomatis]|uniref:Uncharacterized protein n=1 Tax=Peptoanaerobacter stomatis TaxID=796937 RepID=J6H2A8_9FIRM|nr:hypothetical protein [Peptoanaerobacter stomatis]EHL18126.1 hypothetical protein HMPREF9630_01121 [Peptoanaerobacter stomatis]EJU19535.1 hypothetical protein HMPREF1143_0141 [Peptoanaerobacter stomatis]NWO25317.1 hypothetical protein [Peptostreptococcaceae bacterium oral taxon 081]
MNDLRKKAIIRIGIMVAIMLLSIFLAFYIKNIFLKIPFIIIAGGVAALLIRLYISYKRKKLYFDGKVLTITPPKRKIGKYSIIIKNGKVSKKFYSFQKPEMKLGANYVVVYEEKSFNILEFQEAKFQMMNAKAVSKNPKFRM